MQRSSLFSFSNSFLKKFALFLLGLSSSSFVFGAENPSSNDPLKEPPRILKPTAHGVSRMIPDVTFKDIQDHEMSLSKFKTSDALVIATFSADCPISNKLGPELARLESDYGSKKISFLFVSPMPHETKENISKFISKYGLKSPVINDSEGILTGLLNPATTTEVFVLDPARTLVYRGAINDQYGLGYSKDEPSRTYLRDALDSISVGDKPSVAATTAPGCAIDSPKKDSSSQKTTLTYHNQISRIIQTNCIECHRQDGGIAPFSLETYADVVKHAGMIKKQVTNEVMPPWFIDKPAGQKESPWSNDRSLSDQDKADLLAWLDSDRPQGNASDAPIPRMFATKWMIGKPDTIVQIPRPVQIKAEGFMPYQMESVQTSFPEDRWVQAYEIMPTAKSVVHHVLVHVVDKVAGGTPRKTKQLSSLFLGAAGPGGGGGRFAGFGGPGVEDAQGFWAAYVPGNAYRIYPEGYARRLPAGAKLNFQIHYTPNGKATEDQLMIGLVFSKKPPQYEVHTVGVQTFALNIPPGAANHLETAQYKVPSDMNVTGYQAHTHLRGKSFKYELTKPDGTTETLLDLPRYNFNWQLQYDYVEPKLIPAGSKIKVSAIYDNSSNNPANPDPKKAVHWGPQTYDEMMIGYVEYYVPASGKKSTAVQTASNNVPNPSEEQSDTDATPSVPSEKSDTAENSQPEPSDPSSIVGSWKLTVESNAGISHPSVVLKQEGENLTGTYKGQFGEAPVQGTLKGNAFQFSATLNALGQEMVLEYSGTFENGSLKGKVQLGQFGEATFSGEK
jgi:hypothetical protein